jgi:CheY-like chemotaxis protein
MVTLIAVPAGGQAEDRKRALENGFDRDFTKPLEPNTQLQLMAKNSRR